MMWAPISGWKGDTGREDRILPLCMGGLNLRLPAGRRVGYDGLAFPNSPNHALDFSLHRGRFRVGLADRSQVRRPAPAPPLGHPARHHLYCIERLVLAA